MLTTPGVKVDTGEYDTFGIPATILANYLLENGIIPEIKGVSLGKSRWKGFVAFVGHCTVFMRCMPAALQR
ncbi:hypothetical protein [Propionispira raffinosivorans]|uniref:hypothetical protein n=1 Tax=Propionispira raffinosivorans TaxID=86959 RepID=UPI00247FE948|nr:hypothetical protein [Propionispira raffinosivorans]